MDEDLSEQPIEDDDSPSYDEIMTEAYEEERRRVEALIADPKHRVLVFLRGASLERGILVATWSREREQGRDCDLHSYHEAQGDCVEDWLTIEDEIPKESGFWIFDGEFVWEGGGGEQPEWEHRSYGAWRRPTFVEIVDGLQGNLGPKRTRPDHAELAKPDPQRHTTGDALARGDGIYKMTVEPELQSFASTGGDQASKFVWVGRVLVSTPDQGKLHLQQWLSEPELRRRAHKMLAVADEIAARNAIDQPIDEVRFVKDRLR